MNPIITNMDILKGIGIGAGVLGFIATYYGQSL